MTAEEINFLVHCPKIIEEAPKKEMRVDRGSRRNDLRLRTKDGQAAFHVFIRQNEKFPENFSIGLDYLPQDGGRVPLLRCNGPHG